MKTLSAPTVAALGGQVLSIAQLVYLGFPGFPIALCSANHPIEFDGVVYEGAAGLGTINAIEDSPGEIKGLQFQISGVPIENLGLALADATLVQGAPVVIRLAILSESILLDAPIDWTGLLDTMSIEEDGDTCTIAVTAESSAVDLLRGNALTTSNADQQYLYPGDRAFEYVDSQSNIPVVWPSKQLAIAAR